VKHVDLFLAPSDFVKVKHLEMGLRIPVAKLPYFTSRWKWRDTVPRRSPDDLRYFLFVGRLEKIKGLQDLIPLFRRYPKAQLWVAGAGDYETALRQMARNSPNIKFLGYQSGERLRALYERAVATIVPSLWYEAFGLVILESFANGAPVIVRNRGGMPEIVHESGAGFVFDTERELVGAMNRLLEDDQLRDELGERGRRAVQQKWSADAYIHRYLELIEQVTIQKRAKL
jgi:glycosyltransferase involved in cell wall biosynthesis